MMKLELDV